MAQTKASPKKAKPKTRSSGKQRLSASSKTKTNASSKPKARSLSGRSSSNPKSSSRKSTPSKPQAAIETVEGAAKDAGSVVSRAASKAKVPLMAGGAALAAGAGGLALGARQAHRRNGLGGVSAKDLAKAARKAGNVSAQVGEIALEVRRARESANGNGKVHRSPIEVVLQGLTSRRPR
jgi:hypothetical protein